MAPGHLSQNHSVFKILLLLQKNQLDFDSELLRSPFKFIPYSEVSRKLESAAELFRMEASRLPYGPQDDEGTARRPALRLCFHLRQVASPSCPVTGEQGDSFTPDLYHH